jgi:hypothetical protein
MSQIQKIRLCEEIDEFLISSKQLLGTQPVWRQNGSSDRLDGSWVIEENEGISRAYLSFRLNRVSTAEPSVSLIFKKKPVCRVDIKSAEESDGNPIQAHKFGLPGQVYGPHIHRWDYNREYVLQALPPDEWQIPIKEEISPSTQTLGHILAMICSQCKIDFSPEQRHVTLPARERLI